MQQKLMILFLPIALLAQEGVDIKYPDIKRLIQSNQLALAQQKIDTQRKGNQNDSSLLLYQTEVWIKKGEAAYQNRKFKTSFGYYQKANRYWPNHPLVVERYKELSGRKLYDYQTFRKSTNNKHSTKSGYLKQSNNNSSQQKKTTQEKTMNTAKYLAGLEKKGNINIFILDENTNKNLRMSLKNLPNQINNTVAKGSNNTNNPLLLGMMLMFLVQMAINSFLFYKSPMQG